MTPDESNHIHEKLDTILEILTGNGDPSKGIVVRVDRLEQAKGLAAWVLATVIVAVIGVWVQQIRVVRLESQPPSQQGER